MLEKSRAEELNLHTQLKLHEDQDLLRFKGQFKSKILVLNQGNILRNKLIEMK